MREISQECDCLLASDLSKLERRNILNTTDSLHNNLSSKKEKNILFSTNSMLHQGKAVVISRKRLSQNLG